MNLFLKSRIIDVNILKTPIIFFGRWMMAVCDRQCEKAFGINSRPKIMSDDDDIVWFADGEVPEAPANPGTYEGGHGKPFHPEAHNKWCVRECERCEIVKSGTAIRYPDWFSRRFSQPWKHGVSENPTIVTGEVYSR